MFTFAMNNNWMRFCDIHNNEGRGKCRQLSRRLRLITTEPLIIADITKTESNIVLLYVVLK